MFEIKMILEIAKAMRFFLLIFTMFVILYFIMFFILAALKSADDVMDVDFDRMFSTIIAFAFFGVDQD